MKDLIVGGLKYGGLGLSAILTGWLFTDLFWDKTPLGLLLIVFSFILFEGGAMLWLKLIDESQGVQWLVAVAASGVCVLASVFSSIAQIVMATNMFTMEGIDMPMWTLFAIGLSLFTNVVGVIAYGILDPEQLSKHFEKMTEFFASLWSIGKLNKIMREAEALADIKIKNRIHNIAEQIASEREKDVVRMALASTPGGNNSGGQNQNRSPQSQYSGQSSARPTPVQQGRPNTPQRVAPSTKFPGPDDDEEDDDDEKEIVALAARRAFPAHPVPTTPRPNANGSRGPNGK